VGCGIRCVGAAGDNAAMGSFFSLLQKNVLNRRSWTTHEEPRIAIVIWIERTYHVADAGRARTIDPHRIRDHHEHASHTGCVTTNCHLSVQQTLFDVAPTGIDPVTFRFSVERSTN
jgi:hypothetical protein